VTAGLSLVIHAEYEKQGEPDKGLPFRFDGEDDDNPKFPHDCDVVRVLLISGSFGAIPIIVGESPL
jgi:hypothetical protein